MNLLPGTTRFGLTAAALLTGTSVGTSGKPYRMFCVHTSTLTTGKIYFYNGTSAYGSKYVQIDGTTATGTTVNFEGGVEFPNGCYLTADIGLQNFIVVGTVQP